jgi:hypothetical protein
MVRLIYKFLDDYVGTGIKLIKQHEYYSVRSDNNTHILSFKMKDDWTWFKFYRSPSLCRNICGYFLVTEDDAAKYVKDWFGDRNNMIKVDDLKKFI